MMTSRDRTRASTGRQLRELRPFDLIRVLNSTPLGAVVNERRLRSHRARAGARIGTGTTIDLLRYGAWLAGERHFPAAPAIDELSSYAAHKERTRRRQAKQSEAERILKIPPIADLERRESCRLDLARFCKTYFPSAFPLPWSEDHLRVIAKIQRAILEGGSFALAMPRKFGKTTISEAAYQWGPFYGHRSFMAIIGPDHDHARDRIRNAVMALETNDLLLADFPEICAPIRKLDRVYQKRLINEATGRVIRMQFTARRLILPDTGGPASSAIIAACSITGRVRGLVLTLPDGRMLRPEAVLLDDPQNEESAHSPGQTNRREETIMGAVLGLAGPGTKLTAMMPCTKISTDDLADRFLDHDRHPEWQGEVTKMVYAWPTATEEWEEYAKRWKEGQAAGRGIADATEYYRPRRTVMDAGARVAWQECFDPGELSAIQHAWDRRLELKDRAFFAECQNEVNLPDPSAPPRMMADQIAHKLNRHKRYAIPRDGQYITQFIDVQKRALWYFVMAVSDDFNCYVIDYGTEPEQDRPYFIDREIKRTYASVTPHAGFEGAVFAALTRLTQRTLRRPYRRQDGAEMWLNGCLIDAQWGDVRDVVYKFCRENQYASLTMPSHGLPISAKSLPMSSYSRKPGDRVGLNWRIPAVAGRHAPRHIVYDANFWKTFLQARIETAIGDPGALTLWGQDPERHRLLADHLVSETREDTSGRGRMLTEWTLLTGRDNHWWDGAVGCAVRASTLGAALQSHEASRPAVPRPATGPRVIRW